jgi:hypothetical protein
MEIDARYWIAAARPDSNWPPPYIAIPARAVVDASKSRLMLPKARRLEVQRPGREWEGPYDVPTEWIGASPRDAGAVRLEDRIRFRVEVGISSHAWGKAERRRRRSVERRITGIVHRRPLVAPLKVERVDPRGVHELALTSASSTSVWGRVDAQCGRDPARREAEAISAGSTKRSRRQAHGAGARARAPRPGLSRPWRRAEGSEGGAHEGPAQAV